MPADEHVTRCDLRIPNELYKEIEKLAINSGVGVHHRSNKPIVTPTILELIRIGITHQVSDKVPDNLSDRVSDIYLIAQNIEAAITPIIAEIEELKKPVATA